MAQEQLSWEDFADVNFEAEFNEKYGVHFLMPTFGEKIRSLMYWISSLEQSSDL